MLTHNALKKVFTHLTITLNHTLNHNQCFNLSWIQVKLPGDLLNLKADINIYATLVLFCGANIFIWCRYFCKDSNETFKKSPKIQLAHIGQI